MNRNQNSPSHPAWRGPCECISKRLDDLAERAGDFANTDRIRLMRRAYFADVDALEQSGEVKLPE